MNTKQTITAATGQLAKPRTQPATTTAKVEEPNQKIGRKKRNFLPFIGLQYFPFFFLVFCSCQNSQVFRALLLVLPVYPPSANRIWLLHTDKSSCHASLPCHAPSLRSLRSRNKDIPIPAILETPGFLLRFMFIVLAKSIRIRGICFKYIYIHNSSFSPLPGKDLM